VLSDQSGTRMNIKCIIIIVISMIFNCDMKLFEYIYNSPITLSFLLGI
jgi:hypothetical protein